MIKKILTFSLCLGVLLLSSCKKDAVYEAIPQKMEEITTIEQFFDYIDVSIEQEFQYSCFIDVRSESEFFNGRIRYFKRPLTYAKGSDEFRKMVLNYAKGYGKKAYVFVIGSTKNTDSYDLLDLLKEEGFTNVKHITIGFEGFLQQLEESPHYDAKKYIEVGDCGC